MLLLRRFGEKLQRVKCTVPLLFAGFYATTYQSFSSSCSDKESSPPPQQTITRDEWYSSGDKYWSSCESTYDGVMGGYGHLSEIDIKFSRVFLEALLKKLNITSPSTMSVLDCGAGIGRVSKELLSSIFGTVDLVEQCEKYVEVARESLSSNPSMRNFYTNGLQDFLFPTSYNFIWVQWVSNQLRDDDYKLFLSRCATALPPSGVLVVKENISPPQAYPHSKQKEDEEAEIFDETDTSVTRSDLSYKALFAASGFEVIMEMKQPHFPDELFDVKVYALVKNQSQQ